MAFVVKDRVKETTLTIGTGTLTLAGTSAGFQSFAILGNNNETYYTIVDASTGAWEVGLGTYTSAGTTLSRDTVLESSNSGSKVVFGAGTKDVFVTYPAERSVYLDAAGSAVTKTSTPSAGTTRAADGTRGSCASLRRLRLRRFGRRCVLLQQRPRPHPDGLMVRRAVRLAVVELEQGAEAGEEVIHPAPHPSP